MNRDVELEEYYKKQNTLFRETGQSIVLLLDLSGGIVKEIKLLRYGNEAIVDLDQISEGFWDEFLESVGKSIGYIFPATLKSQAQRSGAGIAIYNWNPAGAEGFPAETAEYPVKKAVYPAVFLPGIGNAIRHFFNARYPDLITGDVGWVSKKDKHPAQ